MTGFMNVTAMPRRKRDVNREAKMLNKLQMQIPSYERLRGEVKRVEILGTAEGVRSFGRIAPRDDLRGCTDDKLKLLEVVPCIGGTPGAVFRPKGRNLPRPTQRKRKTWV